MALVEYSGSESDSEDEQKVANPTPAKHKSTSNKPAFQKVVDRSNPHKIKVSLPEPARATTEDGDEVLEPPAKRAKIGPGGRSGFNAFLPAPKRTAAQNGGSGIGMKKGGLGSGISLKTGAAPAFSRESAQSVDESSSLEESAAGGSGLENSAPNETPSLRSDMPLLETETEPKKKSTMFKPLSVANKKAQKKKAPPANSLRTHNSPNGEITKPPKENGKASLFSIGAEINETSFDGSSAKETYQPTMYQAETPTTMPTTNPNPEDAMILQNDAHPYSTYLPEQSIQLQTQSLDAIATDLNLSASAKRQLLGRHHNISNNKTHPSQPFNVPNIVNFNTDEEYAANELLRQAGETVQHNPVRGIAPGKHSLRQLVNAASTQKDALEEHFASGRRNKKEAGSRYGW